MQTRKLMQSLNIDFGGIELAINGDESRVIRFDPEDVGFVDRFLIAAFETKEKEYREKLDRLDKESKPDKHGIPKNAKEYIQLLRGVCEDIRADIDGVFGEGTSQTAFGNTLNLDVFVQFFQGITPFIQQSREKKAEKYLAETTALQ